MKKIISLICILAMLLTAFSMAVSGEAVTPSVWDGVIPDADKNYEFAGQGTAESPWLIRSAAELALFAANVRLNDKDTAYGGKFFKLTVDVDLANHEWMAIGGCRTGSDGLSTSESDDIRYSYFAGTFDGCNHKIYNLALANEKDGKVIHQQGLFGVIMGATIRNLGIESGNVVLTNSNRSGAFCGAGRCGFLIENCYNKANVTITTNFKQAFVGTFMGQVIDPWTNANNTEKETVGIYSGKRFQNVYNTGKLTVVLNQTDGANEFRLGGIVGQFVGGSPEMIGVWNLGDVDVTSNSVSSSKTNHRVGGITGAFLDNGRMENVYYKGKINFVATVATGDSDMSKYQLGAIAGNTSNNTNTSSANNGGIVSVGYQLADGSNFTKAIGSLAEQPAWVAEKDDIAIPFANNSSFINLYDGLKDALVFVQYRKVDDATAAARVLVVCNAGDYTAVSFTLQGSKTVVKNIDKYYTSIQAGGENVSAEDLGGTGIFVIDIVGLTAAEFTDDSHSLTVTLNASDGANDFTTGAKNFTVQIPAAILATMN